MSDRKVLVTNDDGIESDDIVRLAEEAKNFGEVWVVAPNSQRSANSHSMTVHTPFEAWEYDFPVDGVRAFACNGTPADCVRVGILKLIPGGPDYVFSGINYGYNIASDIQYSATVGAALEGAFMGVQSIAFSRYNVEEHEVTDHYLHELMAEYMEKPLGSRQIWNINFPGCKLNECKGIMRDCVISQDMMYDEDYSVKESENGHQIFETASVRTWVGSPGTDLYAVTHNYVSIGVVNNYR